ncbi:MAG TPA: translation initiation factor IF-2, partial [Candidatus Doudnabacteria bacterium]|nr:translation initiation factor IF-2 [Candidatus Doudnabacteria bacterium]
FAGFFSIVNGLLIPAFGKFTTIMNLSSLSHELNMSIQELRAKANAAGFRISPRANKIDNYLARQIKQALGSKVKEDTKPKNAVPVKIELPAFIKVRDFAELLKLPITEVIKTLIQNGVMATINEEIDFETASIIATDLGFEVASEKTEAVKEFGSGFLQEQLAANADAEKKPRAPIVAVMGHVDHGKTTLLDAIRATDVVAGESGGITQHIGAYQVKHDGKTLTFLDTPGHEAFVEMRARGANVTDLIILVVAADDSVRPQTIEVINRAKFTNTPIIVAINKIDKEAANIAKTKQELAEHGILTEDWGGKTIAVEISAKNKIGIDKLLDMVLLQAEVENYTANPAGKTLGTVIESHLSQGQGPVATVIVQNGTLKVGDIIVAGMGFGRVKSMEDEHGKKLKNAGPSTPVVIAGFSNLPEAGDILQTSDSLDEARQIGITAQKLKHSRRLSVRSKIQGNTEDKSLNLILKADVAGSLEAIGQSFNKLKNDEVQINVLNEGIGEVNENDVMLADSSKATIIAFRVKANPKALNLAKQKKVSIDNYDVIYELLEDVTSAVVELFTPEMEKLVFGRAKVLAIFRTEKTQMIIGGQVSEGELRKNKQIAVVKKDDEGLWQEVARGEVLELQQGKVDTKEVTRGNEFGMKIKTSYKLQEGDIIESFEESLKHKSL